MSYLDLELTSQVADVKYGAACALTPGFNKTNACMVTASGQKVCGDIYTSGFPDGVSEILGTRSGGSGACQSPLLDDKLPASMKYANVLEGFVTCVDGTQQASQEKCLKK